MWLPQQRMRNVLYDTETCRKRTLVQQVNVALQYKVRIAVISAEHRHGRDNDEGRGVLGY
jgi:hypothetical protein